MGDGDVATIKIYTLNSVTMAFADEAPRQFRPKLPSSLISA